MTISTFPAPKLVLTRIPPSFFLSPSPAIPYMSFGHLILTRDPASSPSARSARQASTTASANRY